MSTKQLLIVSDPNTNEKALDLWKTLSKNFETTVVNSEERAIELVNRQHFDMAVVDMATAGVDYKKLAAVLPILRNEIALLPYEGETIRELEEKLKAVVIQKRNERIRRFLILDSSSGSGLNSLPAFSAN
jgi:CheY-like chemotaxis protein